MAVVAENFRPEFINRIDETIVFHSLGKEQIRAVTAIQVNLLIARLAAMGIELVVSERALDHLATSGFDPVYGVRPLKRTIQNQLENSLAEQLLAGVFAAGDVINCDVIDGQYSLIKH